MTLYDDLGVRKDATKDEIKAAYRKGAKQHHPDGGGDAVRFTQLTIAYRTLGNEEARKRYDETGKVEGSQVSDPVQDRALHMIGSILANLMAMPHVLQLNIPTDVRSNLLVMQKQATESLAKGNRNIANAEIVAKRLRKKKGNTTKNDYLLQMVEANIVAMRGPLANVQLDLKALERALDLIDLGYDYLVDLPSNNANQFWFSTAGIRT